MELDEDDMEEGDYDDEDMDEEDNGDEYRERSRGRRKDGTIARSAVPSAARKSDTASIDGGASSTKRTKATGAKQASGSDSGGTPAPKRRGATRISVAEFVPPDVSGLSKREARLVKNRAAAFLSRQRKREEFETMEVYVYLSFLTLYNSSQYLAVAFKKSSRRTNVSSKDRQAPRQQLQSPTKSNACNKCSKSQKKENRH